MAARRILIVEDEPQLVVLLERHLKRLGFAVDARSTGSAALEVLNNAAARYDLVVADMGLPDMTGEELLSKLFAVQPKLPVLVCSGSAFFVSSLPDEVQGRVRVLQKPFLPKELASRIGEILGEDPNPHSTPADKA